MKILHPIAYYLPQYHPIPENDYWWGKGFTEWTNVAKAKPLFKGHKQPYFPTDLGYYDLRVPEVREQQAHLARDSGIEGFCYWHYWFGNGKRLLERPFTEVLKSGKPDFPFCLGWANETWSGIWHGAKDRILMKQEYPGLEDFKAHFYTLLPAFLDKRYIKVEDKPLLLIYNPTSLPDMKEFCDVFQNLAIKNNLNGLFLVANNIKNVKIEWDPEFFGFNAYTTSAHGRIIHEGANLSLKRQDDERNKKLLTKKIERFIEKTLNRKFSKGSPKPEYTYRYLDAMNFFSIENDLKIDSYPTIIAGWDNSPRCGKNGLIFTEFTPENFRKHLKKVFPYVEKTKNKIVFIKSWNEWAEGNYLEPESEFGTQFLEVLKEEIHNYITLE